MVKPLNSDDQSYTQANKINRKNSVLTLIGIGFILILCWIN